MGDASDTYHSIRLPYVCDPFHHGLDNVIDVRTPREYEEDHIPGAINLPVLSNEERHLVGITYADNSFEARRSGAALISSNISRILQSHFNDKPRTYSCLVYCWRGGQRSKSIALVLATIGFNVKFLSGGYKNYRKRVTAKLPELSLEFTYKVVAGKTGSGKTLLLKKLEEAGEQVLDFEELANHRGSVLGINYDNAAQPSTKMFESKILQKLMSFNRDGPVWIESEGSRIGGVQIPFNVFEIIRSKVSRVYELQALPETRTRYLISEYKYLSENPAELKETLKKLSKFNAPLKRWNALIDADKREEFVLDILQNHYDPLYKKSRGKSLATYDQSNNVQVDIEEISKKYFTDTLLPMLTWQERNGDAVTETA